MRSISLTAWLVTTFTLVYITFNQFKWKECGILSYDVGYYYLYLPSTVIYKDLGRLGFYPAIIQEYGIGGRQPTYELYPQKKTGRITNKYAVGVAVCELPFFLIAHAYCLLVKSYPADGFSLPYRVSIVFAVLGWVLAGLLALRKFLLLYYDERTASVTLLLITFATNLYFYTVDHIGMSHPFSFAVCAMLCYATAKAYQTGGSKFFLGIGITVGLLTILRPVNLLMALLPLFWPIANNGENRRNFFRRNMPAIAVSVCLCIGIFFLQLGYLKYTSGEWLHFSYEEEGFTFPHSEVWKGLFSYRKGWFVYTPLAIFMMLGLVPLAKRHRRLSLLISVFTLIYWYVIFSWHQWWYGGGFGMRAMVDTYALLALPLAAAVGVIMNQRKYWFRVVAGFTSVFVITLNVFQSYQLVSEVTRWDNTTCAFYWRTFGKLKVSEDDRRL